MKSAPHKPLADCIGDIVQLCHLAIADRVSGATKLNVPVATGDHANGNTDTPSQRHIRDLIRSLVADMVLGSDQRVHSVLGLRTILTQSDIDLIKRVTRIAILTGDFTSRIPKLVTLGDDGSD